VLGVLLGLSLVLGRAMAGISSAAASTSTSTSTSTTVTTSASSIASTSTTTSTTVTTISDPRIVESSGLAASPTDPGVVWTVNDSGDSARTFAVSLATGRTIAVLRERTDARDCEAMTSGRAPDGRSLLWIGDIGDNRADRTSVVLRLVPEPSPLRSVLVTPVNLRVRYPGGPADAESLIWTPSGRLLIVTKGLLGGDVLEVPPAAVRSALAGHDVTTPALARLVGRVSQVLPTDGVALPDGRLVIRDYLGATVYDPPAYDGKALVPQARLTVPAEPQGETMAVVDAGQAVLVGSEGVDQPLYRVAVPAAPHSTSAGGTSTGSQGSARPSGSSASAPGSGGPGVATLVGGALIAVAALTVLGVGVHLTRGRRRAPR
jgi:hypothetical protein